jgi:hypothetical protein
MSRRNPYLTATVDGTLTGKKTYHVKVNLDVMELWGQYTVPHDLVVRGEELSPMSGMVVEDGDYVLKYSSNNSERQSKLRVVDGRFRAI